MVQIGGLSYMMIITHATSALACIHTHSGGPEGEKSLVEKCFLCDANVPFEEGFGASAKCTAGHVLTRCSETLLVIETAQYWDCAICNAMIRPHFSPPSAVGGGAADDVQVIEKGIQKHRISWLTRPSWLAPWQSHGIWCLYCNVKCSLANT